jgi:hypothetical protein
VKRSELVYIIIGLILAGIVGGLVGEIIGSFLPEGTMRTLFMGHRIVGFEPVTLNLYSIAVTLGITLKFNFVSILMMAFVLAYFRWWYL